MMCKTVSNDNIIEGYKKPVWDDVVTEDISETIVEELAEKPKEEVEVHIPPK